MKQCFVLILEAVLALTQYPSNPRNKKATYNCPVAVPQTGRGMCKWLPSVDRNDNERIINTVFQDVSRGIKKNPSLFK